MGFPYDGVNRKDNFNPFNMIAHRLNCGQFWSSIEMSQATPILGFPWCELSRIEERVARGSTDLGRSWKTGERTKSSWQNAVVLTECGHRLEGTLRWESIPAGRVAVRRFIQAPKLDQVHWQEDSEQETPAGKVTKMDEMDDAPSNCGLWLLNCE
jgi:hypothetical protein